MLVYFVKLACVVKSLWVCCFFLFFFYTSVLFVLFLVIKAMFLYKVSNSQFTNPKTLSLSLSDNSIRRRFAGCSDMLKVQCRYYKETLFPPNQAKQFDSGYSLFCQINFAKIKTKDKTNPQNPDQTTGKIN